MEISSDRYIDLTDRRVVRRKQFPGGEGIMVTNPEYSFQEARP